MTPGQLQSLITLAAFVAFIGIVYWAWSSRRRDAFREAARIPLDDDAPYRPGSPGGEASPGAGEADKADKTDTAGPPGQLPTPPTREPR